MLFWEHTKQKESLLSGSHYGLNVSSFIQAFPIKTYSELSNSFGKNFHNPLVSKMEKLVK